MWKTAILTVEIKNHKVSNHYMRSSYTYVLGRFTLRLTL